jgi:signal transduction histidine kinase
VGGATALLACTPLNDEQSELVALLEAGTSHVVAIIEDILMHGTLVSGSFPVAREPLDLARAVLDPAWRMICMQHSQRAKLASLRMRRDVADDVPAVIVGDSTRLIQVVTNILNNSLKFTPEGGSIHLQINVTDEAPAASASTSADGDAQGAPGERPLWLRFTVTDTGIGIEPGARWCCTAAAAPGC